MWLDLVLDMIGAALEFLFEGRSNRKARKALKAQKKRERRESSLDATKQNGDSSS